MTNIFNLELFGFDEPTINFLLEDNLEDSSRFISNKLKRDGLSESLINIAVENFKALFESITKFSKNDPQVQKDIYDFVKTLDTSAIITKNEIITNYINLKNFDFASDKVFDKEMQKSIVIHQINNAIHDDEILKKKFQLKLNLPTRFRIVAEYFKNDWVIDVQKLKPEELERLRLDKEMPYWRASVYEKGGGTKYFDPCTTEAKAQADAADFVTELKVIRDTIIPASVQKFEDDFNINRIDNSREIIFDFTQKINPSNDLSRKINTFIRKYVKDKAKDIAVSDRAKEISRSIHTLKVDPSADGLSTKSSLNISQFFENKIVVFYDYHEVNTSNDALKKKFTKKEAKLDPSDVSSSPEHDKKFHKINDEIKSQKVRLIYKDENEIVDTTKALEIAKSEGLDLVQVVSDTNPPTCKILDYSEYNQDLRFKNSGTINNADEPNYSLPYSITPGFSFLTESKILSIVDNSNNKQDAVEKIQSLIRGLNCPTSSVVFRNELNVKNWNPIGRSGPIDIKKESVYPNENIEESLYDILNNAYDKVHEVVESFDYKNSVKKNKKQFINKNGLESNNVYHSFCDSIESNTNIVLKNYISMHFSNIIKYLKPISDIDSTLHSIQNDVVEKYPNDEFIFIPSHIVNIINKFITEIDDFNEQFMKDFKDYHKYSIIYEEHNSELKNWLKRSIKVFSELEIDSKMNVWLSDSNGYVEYFKLLKIGVGPMFEKTDKVIVLNFVKDCISKIFILIRDSYLYGDEIKTTDDYDFKFTPIDMNASVTNQPLYNRGEKGSGLTRPISNPKIGLSKDELEKDERQNDEILKQHRSQYQDRIASSISKDKSLRPKKFLAKFGIFIDIFKNNVDSRINDLCEITKEDDKYVVDKSKVNGLFSDASKQFSHYLTKFDEKLGGSPAARNMLLSLDGILNPSNLIDAIFNHISIIVKPGAKTFDRLLEKEKLSNFSKNFLSEYLKSIETQFPNEKRQSDEDIRRLHKILSSISPHLSDNVLSIVESLLKITDLLGYTQNDSKFQKMLKASEYVNFYAKNADRYGGTVVPLSDFDAKNIIMFYVKDAGNTVTGMFKYLESKYLESKGEIKDVDEEIEARKARHAKLACFAWVVINNANRLEDIDSYSDEELSKIIAMVVEKASDEYKIHYSRLAAISVFETVNIEKAVFVNVDANSSRNYGIYVAHVPVDEKFVQLLSFKGHNIVSIDLNDHDKNVRIEILNSYDYFKAINNIDGVEHIIIKTKYENRDYEHKLIVNSELINNLKKVKFLSDDNGLDIKGFNEKKLPFLKDASISSVIFSDKSNSFTISDFAKYSITSESQFKNILIRNRNLYNIIKIVYWNKLDKTFKEIELDFKESYNDLSIVSLSNKKFGSHSDKKDAHKNDGKFIITPEFVRSFNNEVKYVLDRDGEWIDDITGMSAIGRMIKTAEGGIVFLENGKTRIVKIGETQEYKSMKYRPRGDGRKARGIGAYQDKSKLYSTSSVSIHHIASSSSEDCLDSIADFAERDIRSISDRQFSKILDIVSSRGISILDSARVFENKEDFTLESGQNLIKVKINGAGEVSINNSYSFFKAVHSATKSIELFFRNPVASVIFENEEIKNLNSIVFNENETLSDGLIVAWSSKNSVLEVGDKIDSVFNDKTWEDVNDYSLFHEFIKSKGYNFKVKLTRNFQDMEVVGAGSEVFFNYLYVVNGNDEIPTGSKIVEISDKSNTVVVDNYRNKNKLHKEILGITDSTVIFQETLEPKIRNARGTTREQIRKKEQQTELAVQPDTKIDDNIIAVKFSYKGKSFEVNVEHREFSSIKYSFNDRFNTSNKAKSKIIRDSVAYNSTSDNEISVDDTVGHGYVDITPAVNYDAIDGKIGSCFRTEVFRVKKEDLETYNEFKSHKANIEEVIQSIIFNKKKNDDSTTNDYKFVYADVYAEFFAKYLTPELANLRALREREFKIRNKLDKTKEDESTYELVKQKIAEIERSKTKKLSGLKEKLSLIDIETENLSRTVLDKADVLLEISILNAMQETGHREILDLMSGPISDATIDLRYKNDSEYVKKKCIYLSSLLEKYTFSILITEANKKLEFIDSRLSEIKLLLDKDEPEYEDAKLNSELSKLYQEKKAIERIIFGDKLKVDPSGQYKEYKIDDLEDDLGVPLDPRIIDRLNIIKGAGGEVDKLRADPKILEIVINNIRKLEEIEKQIVHLEKEAHTESGGKSFDNEIIKIITSKIDDDEKIIKLVKKGFLNLEHSDKSDVLKNDILILLPMYSENDELKKELFDMSDSQIIKKLCVVLNTNSNNVAELNKRIFSKENVHRYDMYYISERSFTTASGNMARRAYTDKSKVENLASAFIDEFLDETENLHRRLSKFSKQHISTIGRNGNYSRETFQKNYVLARNLYDIILNEFVVIMPEFGIDDDNLLSLKPYKDSDSAHDNCISKGVRLDPKTSDKKEIKTELGVIVPVSSGRGDSDVVVGKLPFKLNSIQSKKIVDTFEELMMPFVDFNKPATHYDPRQKLVPKFLKSMLNSKQYLLLKSKESVIEDFTYFVIKFDKSEGLTTGSVGNPRVIRGELDNNEFKFFVKKYIDGDILSGIIDDSKFRYFYPEHIRPTTEYEYTEIIKDEKNPRETSRKFIIKDDVNPSALYFEKLMGINEEEPVLDRFFKLLYSGDTFVEDDKIATRISVINKVPASLRLHCFVLEKEQFELDHSRSKFIEYTRNAAIKDGKVVNNETNPYETICRFKAFLKPTPKLTPEQKKAEINSKLSRISNFNFDNKSIEGILAESSEIDILLNKMISFVENNISDLPTNKSQINIQARKDEIKSQLRAEAERIGRKIRSKNLNKSAKSKINAEFNINKKFILEYTKFLDNLREFKISLTNTTNECKNYNLLDSKVFGREKFGEDDPNIEDKRESEARRIKSRLNNVYCLTLNKMIGILSHISRFMLMWHGGKAGHRAIANPMTFYAADPITPMTPDRYNTRLNDDYSVLFNKPIIIEYKGHCGVKAIIEGFDLAVDAVIARINDDYSILLKKGEYKVI